MEPDSEPTRKLQALVQKRRQLVDERTAQTNRITAQIKLYFPQVLKWFDDLASPMVAAFLERWPTLPQLQAEDPAQVRTFFHQHGSRSAVRIQERLQQIRQAKPLLTDAAVIEPAVLVVRTLLGVVAVLSAGIAQLEQVIRQVATSHPDYFIFSSFPAAGPVMAPRLVAAFGSQRERYRQANQLQSFSGIAPVQQASGQSCTILFRRACPKFLRQTFHEYAGLSIQHCAWARAFHDQQKDHKKSHHAAVRALAFKWIRIMFRCWQSRQPYQESLFSAARQGRAIPLARRPAKTPRPSPTSVRRVCAAECAKPADLGLRKVGDILKSLMGEA